MATYHLHKWYIVGSNDPFLAPELRSIRLCGYRDDDVNKVLTSDVVAVDGRTVTTYSGSTYILEDIDSEYLFWLKQNNIEFDINNPIKKY